MTRDLTPQNDNAHSQWAEQLAEIGQVRSFKATETVFLQEEYDPRVGYIIDGTVSMVHWSDSGQETRLGNVGPGRFIAETMFFLETPLPFEILAATDVEIIFLSNIQLSALLSDQPDMARQIGADQSQKFQALTLKHTEVATLSVVGRVSAELLRLSSQIGVEPSKRVIRPCPVFTELAVKLSTSRETVSRTITNLQRKGVISRTAGAIIIERPDLLQQLIK